MEADREVPEAEDDTWIVKSHIIIRVHRVPRLSLFRPDEEGAKLPIPLKFLDVMRITETDLLDAAENQIKDHWPHPMSKSLSDSWTGTTTFFLRMPPPPPGQKWIAGRLVPIRKGARTEHMRILPEIWRSMSNNERLQAEEEWGVESKQREQTRRQFGISELCNQRKLRSTIEF